MRSNTFPNRHPKPDSVRGKIIEYPRIRPKMPGNIDSHLSPRMIDSQQQVIKDCLDRLLASRHFAAASRRGQLLAYLVNHTLAGDADKISEYAIGLEVFQRPPSFDPRIESQVRTEVSRLRQRLREYYASEGQHDPVLFELPQRSYIVNFEFRNPSAIVERIGAPYLVQASTRPRFRFTLPVTIAVLGLVFFLIADSILFWQYLNPPAAKQRIDSVVVLPFENYAPDHQDDYIADGMTEELTNDLAQWRDLRVVARTSAFAFKGQNEDVRQIGRQLNVDAVLEGSFTRQGNNIRFTAQLNRTLDGYHLWSHSFETGSNNLFGVQEEIANSIADAIRQVRGGGTPPAIRVATKNPKAHDLYLQGEYQYNIRTPESLRKADELFHQALSEDPNFALAYLGVAYTEIAETSLTTLTHEQSIPRARAAAQRALDLDPTLGEANGLIADITYVWDRNWNKAEPEFRRALELGAGPETRARFGWSLATRGLFSEAHDQLRIASEQDPLSMTPPFDEFFAYYFERDAQGEKESLRRMLEIRPDFFGAHALTVVMALQQNDCATARHEADWLEKSYAKIPATKSTLAFAAACENRKAEALRLVKQMDKMGAPAYQVAIVYALLHDADDAIVQLNKSADEHEMQTFYLRFDSLFDPIRSDPRYLEVERRVGLM